MAILSYAALAIAAVAFLVWITSKTRPDESLSHLPLVKFDENNTAKRYVDSTQSILHLGYAKYLKNGQAFRMRNPTGLRDQVILPLKYLDEVASASQDRLSFPLFSKQAFLLDYTEAPQQTDGAAHAVRIDLTRNLGKLLKDMHRECIASFEDTLPRGEDWVALSPYMIFCKTIAQVTARVLAGPELCRNPEWLRVLTDTTIKVMISAQIIRFIYPPRLRWLSRWLFSGSRAVYNNRKAAAKLLLPIIKKRTAASGGDAEREMDGIQWLLDSKKGEKSAQQLAKEIADEQLFLSIASIHTSSSSMLSFVYDLLERGEYLDEIMDEVRQTLAIYPEWTPQSLGKLRKLDSFMKESSRVHPVGMVTMQRSAVKDYTFKDGLHIPAGTQMTMPLQEVSLDPDIYPSPHTFDGYRFLKMRDTIDPNKFHYASVSSTSIGFGNGMHSCPGRFFASCEIKLMLIELFTRYEVKYADGADGKRPRDTCHDFSIVPNIEAKIMLKRRVAG
ncbi:MAG: hypothetical protein M1840_005139 [Geoglossum simile]|nr:MAG: hypothetical protein M1840_005139 [Geoglossum simile]